MERVGRPCIAAAAFLAVGGLIAAAPVTPSLRDAQVADFHLTADSVLSEDSILQGLSDQQGDSNSALLTPVLDPNDTLVDGNLSSSIPDLVPGSDDHSDQALNAMQQLLEAFNLQVGAGEGIAPEALSASVPFLGGGAPPVVGFEGAGGQDAVLANEVSAVLGGFGDHAMATALLSESAALNEAVLAAEEQFNATLVANELALQDAVFGDDSALSPVVNHAFNMFNMIYLLQQQGVNGLLGVDYNPDDLAQLLVLGDPDSDQLQALMAAIADLKGVDFGDIFANFNEDDFTTALDDFFTTLSGGPFGDAFDLSDGAPLADFFAGFGDIFAGVTP